MMDNSQKYPEGLSNLLCDIATDGTKFYWSNPKYRNIMLLQSQVNFAVPRIMPSQTLLKQARQRFIYRTTDGTEPVVVKLFPLSVITSKFRHAKYAYREFCNTIGAQNRGVSVPQPLCFIEKRRMGLVCCSGIIQQSLDNYSDLRSLYDGGHLSYIQAARHAAPVIAKMFDRGVNHIDLRDENIMLNRKTGIAKVIDWQYARFVDQRAEWLLEYLAAYFIRLAPETYRAELASNWLPLVAEYADVSGFKLDLFMDRTRALLRNRARVVQRLALKEVTA